MCLMCFTTNNTRLIEETVTPTHTYGECVICLEEMSVGLSAITCGHIFHERCIDMWLSKKYQCPICGTEVLSI